MTSEPVADAKAALIERVRVLEAMVKERDSTLQAIQCGDIDALVVTEHPDEYQLYTLQSIDQPYRVFIEQIQEGAVTLREDGTMLYCNARFASMLDIPKERVLGQKLQRFLLPLDTAVLSRMLNEAKLVSTRRELELCPTGGTRIAASFSLSFLRNENDTTLLCGVMTDISEQKKNLEELSEANAALARLADDFKGAQLQAEQANQAKSRFLAVVTHELRTPLHSILGYAELLSLEGDLNPIQSERIQAMMAAGHHLLGTINAVLDMSQIEADELELHPVETDLPDLLRACLDVVRPAAEAKGLALVLAPSPPFHPTIDPMRLRQVLVNLLGNAIKFTPAGTVEMRLRLTETGDCMRLEVADTGPGIWFRHRDKLFQTFERLNAQAVSGIEGTGLGLAIAARLVGLMGGRIGYLDNPGGGSVFWLELPWRSGVPQIHSSQGAAAALTRRLRLRVLVADDEILNRNIASGFLSRAGHDVVCVDNGAAAVAAAAAEDFDVILMDVRMPGMNGLEATRQIRALPAPRGRVRVVAVTAQAFAQQIEVCRQAGMDNHVSKPFTLATLLAALEARTLTPSVTQLAVVPMVTAPAAAGPEFPVLDQAMFDDVRGSLSAEKLTENLQMLITRGEAMLGELRGSEMPSRTLAMAEAAHKLAGGAGTFGFLAVAAAARWFEVAADMNAEEAGALAAHLAIAIEAALATVRQILVASASPEI